MKRRIDRLEDQVIHESERQLTAILHRYGNDPDQLREHASVYEKQVVYEAIRPVVQRICHLVQPLVLRRFVASLGRWVGGYSSEHAAVELPPLSSTESIVTGFVDWVTMTGIEEFIVETTTPAPHAPDEVSDEELVLMLEVYLMASQWKTPAPTPPPSTIANDQLAEYAALFERMHHEHLS